MERVVKEADYWDGRDVGSFIMCIKRGGKGGKLSYLEVRGGRCGVSY